MLNVMMMMMMMMMMIKIKNYTSFMEDDNMAFELVMRCKKQY